MLLLLGVALLAAVGAIELWAASRPGGDERGFVAGIGLGCFVVAALLLVIIRAGARMRYVAAAAALLLVIGLPAFMLSHPDFAQGLPTARWRDQLEGGWGRFLNGLAAAALFGFTLCGAILLAVRRPSR